MYDGDDTLEQDSATTNDDEAGAQQPCTHCGSTIQTATWHPIRGRLDETGQFSIYEFCDEGCRRAWEHSDADDHDTTAQ